MVVPSIFISCFYIFYTPIIFYVANELIQNNLGGKIGQTNSILSKSVLQKSTVVDKYYLNIYLLDQRIICAVKWNKFIWQVIW